MARVVRAERWTGRESNAGTRLDFCRADQMIRPVKYLELSGREELTFGIDPDHPWVTALADRQVIRLVYSTGPYEEWRVWTRTPARRKDGSREFKVFCRSIKFDLGDEMLTFTQVTGAVLHHHELGDITASNFLDAVIASDNWPADFVKGTVEPGSRHFFVLDWETHLAALTEAANTTVGCELQVERNGTTEYVVSMLDEIRAGETSEIRFANNALESEVEYDYTESGTLIYPRGEGPQGERPSIAGMRWVPRTSDPTPTTDWQILPFDGTTGGGGGYQVANEDDQLNGLYLEDEFGNLYEIVDSTIGDLGGLPSPDRFEITLDTAVSIAGQVVWIRANAAGDELTHIPVPSKIAVHGRKARVLDREDIPGVTNLVNDPFNHGTEGINWDKIGAPTIASVSAPDPLVAYGTTTTKVTADAGEGIAKHPSAAGTYRYMTSIENPHLSFQAVGHLEAGAVKFEVALTWTPAVGDARDYVFPHGTDEDGSPIEAVATQPGAPFEFSIEPQTFNFAFADAVIAEVGSITALELRLTATVDGTIFYVDAWQIVNSIVFGPKIVAGASATKLWDAGSRAIANGAADPKARLRTTALDFNRLGENPLTGAQYPYDAMLPGVTARLVDAGIGLDESRRIFSVKLDLANEALTALELVEAEVVA